MVVVLPEPFTPTTMTTAGGSVTRGMGRSAASNTSSRCSAISCLICCGIAHLFAVHALADALQNLGGGIDADIGGNQCIFHFFENIGVDLFAPGDGVLQAVHQTFAGLLNAGLKTLQQVGFLRDGAE